MALRGPKSYLLCVCDHYNVNNMVSYSLGILIYEFTYVSSELLSFGHLNISVFYFKFIQVFEHVLGYILFKE